MGNLDLRVDDKYRLQSWIGGGSWGDVYIGTNVDTGEDVAIKLEHASIGPSLLKVEAEMYQTLSGGAGIPYIHWYGDECNYRAMVLDLLGPSLEDLFNFCSRRFTLKTVLLLADQLIHRLEYLHSKRVIHRDIKPENFLMGVGRRGDQVYVTDMGLANYATYKAPSPVPSRKENLIGSALFASINGHLGLSHSRRDDMESLGYMILYFLRPLPWEGYKRELQMKRKISTHDLCNGLPDEFAAYFDHLRSLRFGDRPNYSYLRRTFRRLFDREGFERDHVFDWTILKFILDEQ